MASKPCVRCGQAPKEPGPGRKYCANCRVVVQSPAAVRTKNNLNAANSRARRGMAKRKSLDAPVGSRWCPGCELYINLDQFGTYPGGSVKPYCKSCFSVVIHGRQMKTRFGISADEYTELLDRQGGGCAICGTRPRRQRLAVDHDHKTGFIRGLLCKLCNKSVLGGARDSADILRRAADYLDTPPAQEVIGERVAPNPSGRKKK